MDFGRVDDPGKLEGFDPTLPPDAPGTARVLELYRLNPPEPRLRVGAPVWAHPKLAQRLYPKGLKGSAAFAVYGQAFNTIELNSTFYSDPREELARLSAAVPETFRFAPKLPRAITHDARLVGEDASLERFASALERLGPQRGPAWALLPPGFGPSESATLERFLDAWGDALHPLAVEVREPEWFSDPGALERLAAVCERHRTALVITDVIGRRDVLHMRLTAPFAFVRFTGNRLHASDFTRLEAWLERLAEWFEGGLREAWLFLHQPDEGLVIELAQQVSDFARERLSLEIARPQAMPVERQGDLFL
ncbi:MAG: DUF72 domain-containing protein [Planctomycetota bacterium]